MTAAVPSAVPLLASLKAGFEALPPTLVEAGALGAARRAALADLLEQGLPGSRSERWRYTPLRALQRRAFATSRPAPITTRLGAALDALVGARLVFVNGCFDASLSVLDRLPDRVSLMPLSSALAAGEPRAVAHLARRFDRADQPFARANAALATEGVLLRAEPEARGDRPIHLVFIGQPADQGEADQDQTSQAQADQAWHLRHLIELRENASLSVIEHHLGAAEHRHFANTVGHVHLKPGARLSHIRIQDEAAGATLIGRTEVVLAGGAEYRRIDLELGAGLSRHEIDIALHGQQARVCANGVLLADGTRRLDTRIAVEHAAPDSQCDLIWRAIGADAGQAALHGGILIQAGADRCEAALSSKNLLLSEDAEIDAQPVLEIHADEVKAAHGATVGRLDETALFYLRSRGVPVVQARRLLIAAFCQEALAVLDDEAQQESLALRVEAALAGMGDRS